MKEMNNNAIYKLETVRPYRLLEKDTVSFTNYWNIDVEADSEDEAIDIAEQEYGDTYDEVEVWESEEE